MSITIMNVNGHLCTISPGDAVETGNVAQAESGRNIRWKMLITAAIMGLLIGGFAA